MYKNKKLTITISIILLSLLFIVNSSLAQDELSLPEPRVKPEGDLTVAYCRSNLAWASGIRPYKQMHIEGAYRGWEMVYVTDMENPLEQRNAVDSLIARDVDAIIIDNFQILQFPDLAIKAREKGIGVYCLDTPLVPGVLAETTMPNGVFSAEMAYYGLGQLNGEGDVALIGWELTDWGVQRTYPIQILLEKGFKPGINLVEYTTLDQEKYIEEAFSTGAAWAQKYGAELDWIHCPFDGIAMPVVRALEQAGLTREDIIVTGIDAGIEACQMIMEGTPFKATYGQFFEAYAHYICEVIEQVQIKGIPIDAPESIVPAGRVIRFPGMLIDETNVPQEGDTAYKVHAYDGLDPEDPDAWVNWYKAVDMEAYRYEYPK